jgi:hypothetical protein
LRKKAIIRNNNSKIMLDTLENIGYVKPNENQTDTAVEMRTKILPPIQSQEDIPLNNLDRPENGHGLKTIIYISFCDMVSLYF